MREIPIDDRRRAIATAALLSSDNDGEALSAARTLCRLLGKHGLDPATALSLGTTERQPPAMPWRSPLRAQGLSPHQISARTAASYPELLSEADRRFLREIAERPAITPRERDKLNTIAAAVERGRR